MRLTLPHSRSRHGLLLATALVAGGAGMLAVAGPPPLIERQTIRVLTPADGGEVGPDFLLSWTGPSFPAYAVVVDHELAAPGASVRPGRNVVVVEATAVRLTLGPRSGGSPTARRHHTVVVLPLDADGRRVGEHTAVLHVRSGA